ncbi:MAG: DUF6531 domain-containing protein, partial [Candidatus Aureabacteria bacterium]|nr:DUF6531 domain-containing protein [Candidatus Auribacterota bacterium]
MTTFLGSKLCKTMCILLSMNIILIGIPRQSIACRGNKDCLGKRIGGKGNGLNHPKSSASANGKGSENREKCQSCLVGDSITGSSGNLNLQIKPFELTGIGLPVKPVLVYNSQGSKSANPYGRGWILNYDRRIKTLDEGKTKIECEDGTGDVYTYNIDNDGVNYSAKKKHGQEYSRLYLVDPQSGDYIEEYKNGTKDRFSMDETYGYITSITDRHGNSLTFARDGNHKIQTITDSSARVITFSYSNGKLSRITLSVPGDGAPAPVYRFSCGATLESYQASEGALTEFFYDNSYRMTRRVHNGEEVQYFYGDLQESNTVMESKRLVDGHEYSKVFEYDRTDKITTVTDEAGFIHVTRYNDFGDTIQNQVGTEANGQFEAEEGRISGWGADGRRIYDVKINGKANFYNYDNKGNVTYKQEGKLDEGQYARGISHSYAYTNDNLITDTDSLGRVTSYEYDSNNNKTKKTQLVTDPDTSQQQQVIWQWTFYGSGLLQSATDPNGNVTTYEYDQYGNPIDIQLKNASGIIAREEVMTYNAINQLKQKKQRIDSTRWLIADYTYDSEGRVLRTTYGDASYEENTYDCCNLVSRRDRNGNSTGFEYHGSGKIWKEKRTIDGADYVTEYNYNGRDELVSLKTYALIGEQPQNVAETTYQYEAAGRKSTVIDALGNHTEYAYDDQGRPISETKYLSARPVVTSYGYDGYGHITSVSKQIDDSNSAITQYEYDTAGRRAKMIDPLLQETTYTYDKLDRVVQINEPASKVTRYRYDGNGNRVKGINALGKETVYAYNALNKVTSITQPVNEGTIATVTT